MSSCAVSAGGPRRGDSGLLRYADLVLDEDGHEVWRGDQLIHLSPTEFALLSFLLRNAGRVMSRAQILEHVWHYDFNGDSSVVDSYIRYLRRKIDIFEPPLIETVRGIGYTLGCPGIVDDRMAELGRWLSLRTRLVIGMVGLLALGLTLATWRRSC